jgi:phage-related protein
MTSPVEHVEDSLKLTNDGIVDLYEITLRNTGNVTAFIRFRDGPIGRTSVWGSKTFDHLPTKMGSVSRSSEEQKSRPTLTLMNPQGIFNAPAFAGQFDGALLQHYRVLRTHFEAGVLISDTRVWFIARPKDLIGGQSISFELRALSDGPDQLIPGRQFIRPDFPFVRF